MSAFDYLSTLPDEVNPDQTSIDPTPDTMFDEDSKLPVTDLLAYTTRQVAPPSDIRRVLSQVDKRPPSAIKPRLTAANKVTIDGKTYVACQHISYAVTETRRNAQASLVDRGANGGVAGNDVRVIWTHPHQSVDVRGIDDHEVTNILIITAGGIDTTQFRPVIAILHQYAYLGKGKTIHSCGQLEWYQNEVNDKSVKVGGSQCIRTLDGYVHPLNLQWASLCFYASIH